MSLTIDKEILSVNNDNICKHCPHLNDPCSRVSTVSVYTREDKDIDILIVGQGAGKQEDININVRNTNREPFVGKAGKYLRDMISYLWNEHGPFNIAMSNNVRCHPVDNTGKDRVPTKEEITRCKHHLYNDIMMLKPKAILCVGKSASSTFLNDIYENVSVSKLRLLAKTWTCDDENFFKIGVTYHPSFLCRQYNRFDPNSKRVYDSRVLSDIKYILNFSDINN